VPLSRGKRVARKAARTLPLFGIWKGRKDVKDVAAYVARLRSGRR